MQEVVINVRVKDNEVEELQKDLNKLGVSFDEVDGKVKNLGDNTKNEFGDAQDSASNLRGGVEGVGQEFIKVGKAAKKGGAAIKSALISTGVGALIVALGLIIDNWEAIAEAVGLVNKDIERQNELLSIQGGVLDSELQFLEQKLKSYKAQGRSLEDIAKVEQQILTQRFERLEKLNEEINTANQLFEKARDKAKRNSNEENIKAAADAKKEVLALLRERLRIQDAINEAQTVTITGNSGNKDKDLKEGREKVTGVGLTEFAEEIQRQIDFNERLKELFSDRENAFVESQNRQNDAYIQGLEQQAAIATSTRENDKEQAQQLEDFKLNIAQAGLASLSLLAEQGSGFAKAVGVAQAIISTYQGINKALAETTDFTPTQTLRFANAAAVGIAGFANVANILKQKPIQTGGTPSIGGGGGGSSAQAPSFNLVGSSGISQLSQQLNQDQEPIQAFVVASAVTSQQELDQNIVDGATID